MKPSHEFTQLLARGQSSDNVRCTLSGSGSLIGTISVRCFPGANRSFVGRCTTTGTTRSTASGRSSLPADGGRGAPAHRLFVCSATQRVVDLGRTAVQRCSAAIGELEP